MRRCSAQGEPLAVLLPKYPNAGSITVDHAAEQTQGDHFEGQNAASERQPESASVDVS